MVRSGVRLQRLLTALTLALGASSCSTPTLRIYTDTPDMAPLIEAAGEPLDIRLRAAKKPGPGVMRVEFRDQYGNTCGRALERIVRADGLSAALKNGVIDCEPLAWSCNDLNSLAHEVGHVAGMLQHVDEDDPANEGNLMLPAPGTGEVGLNDKQQLQLKTFVVAFNEACR